MDDVAVRIDTATDGDARAWDAFVASCSQASGYHLWGWRAVFERAFRHEAIYLIARRAEVIVGVLPLVAIRSMFFARTLTSLPFVNYGGVIADDQHAGQALVHAAGALARSRGCGHVELRHADRRFPALPCKQHKVAMRLAPSVGSDWTRRCGIRSARRKSLA
jgi:hypothetical protein